MIDLSSFQHETPKAAPDFTEVHLLHWHDISVRIVWNPVHYADRNSTFSIGHLEVTSEDGQPLPITETGYVSRFLARDHVAGFGGALDFVTTWLDEAAAEPDWQDYLSARRQLGLF
jgi:hypothetical protein